MSMTQKIITLLTAQTSTNNAPSGAAAGTAVQGLGTGSRIPETATIIVKSTAGSGELNCKLKIWGYIADSSVAIWAPLGVSSTATNRGLLNEGNLIEENAVSDNVLYHAEPISYLSCFDRIYCELVSINGTSTAISVMVVAGG